METGNLSRFIKEQATLLGFDQCGISPVLNSSKEVERLEDWISKGYHAEMSWMERSIPLRSDPSLLLPDIKSVVVVMMNYHSSERSSSSYRVSRYAQHADYHYVLKSRLNKLLTAIQTVDPAIEGRAFVDSGPIFEKAYAVNAGLGWIGKNSCLILPQQGSFFFIGTLLLTAELAYDAPFTANHCGACTRCMEACPTNAIVSPCTVDANRCVSYLTIEHREPIPESIDFKATNQLFGCDICQEACPHQRFSRETAHPEFHPSAAMQSLTDQEWETMTPSEFKKRFKHSPLQRAGYQKIMSNISYLKGQNEEA